MILAYIRADGDEGHPALWMVRAIVGRYFATFLTGVCLSQDDNNERCFDDLASWTLRPIFLAF